MTSDLRSREAQFFLAAVGDPPAGCAHCHPAAAMLQFLTADFALAAFLGNDLLDRQAASLEFHLSPLAVFCFLPYGLYEVSPAQDPLVRLLLLSFSAPGKNLGPATDKPQMGKPQMGSNLYRLTENSNLSKVNHMESSS